MSGALVLAIGWGPHSIIICPHVVLLSRAFTQSPQDSLDFLTPWLLGHKRAMWSCQSSEGPSLEQCHISFILLVTGPAWTLGWRLYLSVSGLACVYRDGRLGWQPHFQADYKQGVPRTWACQGVFRCQCWQGSDSLPERVLRDKGGFQDTFCLQLDESSFKLL